MSDYREELYQSFCNALVAKGYDQNIIKDVADILILKLANYEIAERCTELAVVENESEQLLKYFLGTLYTENKSQGTIKAYHDEVQNFHRFIAKPLTQANVMDFRTYLANEMKRVSESTVENKRSYLSSFYQFLTREEMITKNPMLKIKPIKFQASDEDAFNDVEIDQIRNACQNLRDRCIVELALSSGARNDEICSLNIEDIDFQNLEVLIRHGKGDKKRTTFISSLCASYLKKYLSQRKDNSPYLFINRNGNRMNKNNVAAVMRGIGERTGITGVHCHRFRKTFATTMSKRGVDLHIIQQLLGHADINTTVNCYIKTDKIHIKNEYVKAI